MSATHQTPAPMTEGEAGFGAGQTPASPTVPLGEAGPHSSDADAVGAPASGGPRWAPVDDERGDLLDLLANEHPATPQERDEYPIFLGVLEQVASANDGFIDQNRTRPILRGQIKHCRTGPFFHRACREGLIRAEGWTVTTRSPSGNGGKPARSYVWIGAAS